MLCVASCSDGVPTTRFENQENISRGVFTWKTYASSAKVSTITEPQWTMVVAVKSKGECDQE